MTEYRPTCGSCARCCAPLGWASVEAEGRWYCSPSCAEGDPRPARRPSVSEPWLYGVPRRFFRARKPKELRSHRPPLEDAESVHR